DGATVDRAGGERAADSQLDARGPVLADQHQDVDHLPRSLRGAVAAGELRPERVEAVRPGAAVASLRQRQRTGQAPGLALKQLEIVIELRAGAEPAVQALMARDLLAA